VVVTRVGPAAHTAQARAPDGVREGARGDLPGRVRYVEPSPADPLVGQTVGVRFRDKRDGTSYFLIKVLAVDRGEGGPVPAITADLPGPRGGPPVRSVIAPLQTQQLVLFDAMDQEERNLAMADWERDRRDEQAAAPHREWEEVARAQIQFLRRGGALPNLWTSERSNGMPEAKSGAAPGGFRPEDLFRPFRPQPRRR
jgi:hypothetical protein